MKPYLKTRMGPCQCDMSHGKSYEVHGLCEFVSVITVLCPENSISQSFIQFSNKTIRYNIHPIVIILKKRKVSVKTE